MATNEGDWDKGPPERDRHKAMHQNDRGLVGHASAKRNAWEAFGTESTQGKSAACLEQEDARHPYMFDDPEISHAESSDEESDSRRNGPGLTENTGQIVAGNMTDMHRHLEGLRPISSTMKIADYKDDGKEKGDWMCDTPSEMDHTIVTGVRKGDDSSQDVLLVRDNGVRQRNNTSGDTECFDVERPLGEIAQEYCR